ncbi:MAG: nuclear transport factor 2 family protein, partial [Acidimicrobiales bacterium]
DDAVMEITGDGIYRGKDEIMTIFTGARDRLTDTAASSGYLRHFTATHQIDVLDETRANGRCYFTVITTIGLDHWGRYIDRYTHDGERWLFAARTVTVDGYAAGSLYA